MFQSRLMDLKKYSSFFIVLSKVVGISCSSLPNRCCNLLRVVVVKSSVTVVNSFSVCSKKT